MYKNFNNACDTREIVGRWCCPDPCHENTDVENGDTYVNGKRMDSDEPDDDTKIYIFKNRTERNS